MLLTFRVWDNLFLSRMGITFLNFGRWVMASCLERYSLSRICKTLLNLERLEKASPCPKIGNNAMRACHLTMFDLDACIERL